MIKHGCKERAALRPYEEYVTNRLVITLAWSAVLMWGMTLLQTVLVGGGMTYYIASAACMFLAAVSAISMIFGLIWYIIAVRRGSHTGGGSFHGGMLSFLSLMSLICCGLLLLNSVTGIRVIYAFLPLCGLLFLVYSVYPRRSFVFALTHSVTVFCLYALYKLRLDAVHDRGLRAVFLVAGLCVSAFALALYFATRSRDGRVVLSGISFDLFGGGASDLVILLVYGVTALVLLGGYFLGGYAALAGMAAAALFVLAVLIRETVRMIYCPPQGTEQ